MNAIASTRMLAPGAAETRQYTLNLHMAVLKPGTYSVSGAFEPRLQSGIHARSNRVVFRILQTSPDTLRQRLSELTRQIAADPRPTATLLGFTGDAAAIPPLVDLLYHQDDGVQVAAADALLYFDRRSVRASLVEALRQRGPRERMIDFLVVELRTPNALTRPWLLLALRSGERDSRAAAVEGLYLSNFRHDPALFAPLATMLRDPVALVRQKASAAVGGYQNQQALTALVPLVDDSDASVAEQATIAVGWIAQSSAVSATTRRDAIDVLRTTATAGRGRASEAARQWLTNADAR
jgi:HEAT repeat protein/Armadillo/beta-catenin-like repeat-containing protein